MSETSEAATLLALQEKLDDLSTQLLVAGIGNDCAQSLERIADLAAELTCTAVESCARELSAQILNHPDDPALPGLVRQGLMEIRRLLNGTDEGPSTPDASRTTGPEAKPLAVSSSLAADEDLIREFIAESSDHLASIEAQLLLLENDNTASEPLHAIFRGFHTIKGLAGFLEFHEIQAITHEVETLLDLARNAQLVVSPSIVDVLLESMDIVRHELASIVLRMQGKAFPPSRVNDELLERIRQAALDHNTVHPQSSNLNGSSAAAAIESNAAPATTPASLAADTATNGTPSQATHHPERRVGDASSIRIDTAKLDQLMDMVGEMVIAQTLIQHNSALNAISDATIQRNLTQLARITADVQRITTGMRMVPIGLQFQKTARLVRDLARRAGKQIVFESSGEDTELDKSIAEQLSDPLLHMVRNSIDHGIESAEERHARGKDPIAHVRVSAYHQAGQIVVEVSDDGRGLDCEKILAKAQQNGLVQRGAQLNETEIFQLIFEAGFSTAAKVTDISGRGVGMDVVRRHVQKLRGRIDIQSSAGLGTTFFIRLPLTLAIIDGLVVMVGEQRYIVPIHSVREMFRPTPAMLSTVQGRGEMAMVRGGLLPIVRLHRSFGIQPHSSLLTEGTLIVTESQGSSFCLFVDALVGKQEVVIKSLGRRFKDVAGVAGCAILGDGRVGLILDIEGIYNGRR